MPESDDYETELRGDEGLRNVKGNDWVASIVTGLIVGLLMVGATRLGNRSDDTRDQVIALRGQVAGLVNEVQELKRSPYVRREEYDREFQRIDKRLEAIENAVRRNR